jgi:HEAT repeat protein
LREAFLANYGFNISRVFLTAAAVKDFFQKDDKSTTEGLRMMPNEELSTIIQNLVDPDPSVRRTAAEALSEADERAIYPLIRLLRDDNAGVQDAAIRSLVAIGGEVTAYMALPLLREGPFIRNAARLILRQIGHPSVMLLRPLLGDKDDDIRNFSVDLIADIGSCDYADEIMRLLETDPNQNVRASAARALAVLDYRAGVPALTASLHDNEWVCFSSLESLALMKDEASVDPILTLLGNPSETIRYAAIEALGKIGSPRSSAPLIARLPKSSDIEKSAIVRSLVQIGITPAMAEVADSLMEMFSKGEWEERLVALTGLSELKFERAIPIILDVAGALDPSDPENEELLFAVKQALLKFGCMPALLSVLADPGVKYRGKVLATEIVGEIQCADAVPSLIGLLSADLRDVRRAAVLALANIRGDEALAVLRKCVDDRDGHVRSAAITELGRMGDQPSAESLLRHINVENYHDVLEETVKALLRIDARLLFTHLPVLSSQVRGLVARYAGDAEVLLSLSREPDANIRVAALTSLASLQDERGRKRLSEALGDDSPEARKTAVIALGNLNAGVDELSKALGDKDMWVRLYAVKALGESQDARASSFVIPLLSDAEVPVILSAIDALLQLGGSDTAAISALRNHDDEQVRERASQVVESLC